MRIEWIEVENFKGFDKRRFEFDEHFTLIVGENGTGKTSAIMAVGEVLRAWCMAFSMGEGINYQAEKDKLRVDSAVLGTGKVNAFVLPLRLKAAVRLNDKMEVISTEAEGGETTLVCQGFRESLTSIAMSLRNDGVNFQHLLPVCAWFPASRRFSAGKPNWEQIMSSVPMRPDGYRDLQNSGLAASNLTAWIGKQEAIAKEEGRESGAYKAMKHALISILPESQDIWFSVKQGEICIRMASGEVLPFSKLSDGQQTVIAMACEIVRRASLLNPHLDASVQVPRRCRTLSVTLRLEAPINY